MKKTVLKGMAKASKAMAVKTCGAASYFGYHHLYAVLEGGTL